PADFAGRPDLTAPRDAPAADLVSPSLFTVAPTTLKTAAGGGPWGIATGDFDLDGKADLVTVGNSGLAGGGVATIFLGKGGGMFQAAVKYTNSKVSTVITIAAGDYDGDGNLDLALGSDDFAMVFRNAGNGTFSSGAAATCAYPNDLVSGDVDGDKKLDLLCAM